MICHSCFNMKAVMEDPTYLPNSYRLTDWWMVVEGTSRMRATCALCLPKVMVKVGGEKLLGIGPSRTIVHVLKRCQQLFVQGDHEPYAPLTNEQGMAWNASDGSYEYVL